MQTADGESNQCFPVSNGTGDCTWKQVLRLPPRSETGGLHRGPSLPTVLSALVLSCQLGCNRGVRVDLFLPKFCLNVPKHVVPWEHVAVHRTREKMPWTSVQVGSPAVCALMRWWSLSSARLLSQRSCGCQHQSTEQCVCIPTCVTLPSVCQSLLAVHQG